MSTSGDDRSDIGDESVAISTMSILSFVLVISNVVSKMELHSEKLEWMLIKNGTVGWDPEENAQLSKGGFPQVHE